MHNAALLTNENKELRAANERQKKRKQARRYIAQGGGLSIEEGLQLAREARKVADALEARKVAAATKVAAAVEATKVADALEAAIPKPRAVRHCSICHSTEHTARTCSQK